MKLSNLIFIAGGLMVACSVPKESEKSTEKEEVVIDQNPAAEGFNLQESDPKAIELADACMEAMGGRKNWNNTRPA